MIQVQLGLLAFFLAFTFGFAAQRFNDRRVLIIEEANSIGTTYLRADFLQDANKKEVQHLLRQYVDVRIKLARQQSEHLDRQNVDQALADSAKLQNGLWAQAVDAGRQHPDSPVIALFIDSLNQTIDLQSERVSAERSARIPEIIWIVLYAITFLGMTGLGYQFGNAKTRNWVISSMVVFSYALVMMMIADLDRPSQGFFRSSQKPLTDLSKQIGSELKDPGVSTTAQPQK
ncbi:MAG TPA: DUF4239 domain-containing protein [Trichormus sp.]